MAEIGVEDRKIGRRRFLKTATGAALGGAIIGATIAERRMGLLEKGVKGLIEWIIPRTEPPLWKKEITGQVREAILGESDGNWPVVRREPSLDPKNILGYVAPGTKIKGKEIYGGTYPSIDSQRGRFPAGQEHYGRWFETTVSLGKNAEGVPIIVEGKVKAFFSANFLTFPSKEK